MDKILFDVRKIREQIVAECNFDMHTLCEELRRRERQNKKCIMNFSVKKHNKID